jgi:hypothetical protein
MRHLRLLTLCICAAGFALPAIASHVRRGPTSPKVAHKHTAKAHILGQRGIDDARATELQEALIKAGYLTGEPSGHWDSASEAAMSKLQADNGWQTKLVPDSRAIIKLGLGPGTAYTAKLPAAAPTPQFQQTGQLNVNTPGLPIRP